MTQDKYSPTKLSSERSRNEGPASLLDVWNHEKAGYIYTMDFSFNFIIQVIELLLQYQMALVFLTSSSFTAATCIIAVSAAFASLIASIWVAPYLNRVLSNRQLGTLLPILLASTGALFLALVFMPGLFSSWFAAMGLPGVNIILLSCIVGAFLELVRNSVKYPISDVFTSDLWKSIEERAEPLQKTSNFFSGKPAKACSALLVILLATLSATGVANVMWVTAPILAIFFFIWFRSVRKVTNNDTSEKTIVPNIEQAPSKPSGFFTHIKDKQFQVVVSIGVLCTLGSAALLALKNTIIVASAGAVALPYLKALILPAIWAANEIMGRVEKKHNTNALLIFLCAANALLVVFTVLYPYAHFIHALSFTAGIVSCGPSAILQFWMFSLFYITVEVWSSAASERIYKPLQTKAFNKEQLRDYIPSISIIFCISTIIAMGVTLLMAELSLPVSTMLIIATSISVCCAIGVGFIYKYGLDNSLFNPVTQSVDSSEYAAKTPMVTPLLEKRQEPGTEPVSAPL